MDWKMSPEPSATTGSATNGRKYAPAANDPLNINDNTYRQSSERLLTVTVNIFMLKQNKINARQKNPVITKQSRANARKLFLMQLSTPIISFDKIVIIKEKYTEGKDL